MKKCDDCSKMFENNSVFVCEKCNKRNTCMNCVGTSHKIDEDGIIGHYDTLCRKCLKEAFRLIDEHIAKYK